MATNNIWNLLVSSGLVESAKVAEIRTQCEGDLGSDQSNDSTSVLNWLRQQKGISQYQLQVLQENQPGPFRFDQYRVHGKHTGGPLDGSYRAIHVSSNHPVRIHFVGGRTAEDAERWASIRQVAATLPAVKSPFVSRCFEFVQDGDYRFVVFEDRPGKSLLEKLPFKGRLPWPQTFQAIELVALGLSTIHQAGLAHRRIWPGAIWLQRSGICQILWQIPNLHFDPNQDPELAKVPLAFQAPANRQEPTTDLQQAQRNDLFSLGALAFRLVAGRAPKINGRELEKRNAEIDKHLAYCEKHNLPESITRLLRLLLTADISNELKDANIAAMLTGTILESQSIKADIEPDLPGLSAYQESLDQKQRSQGFLDTLESIGSVPRSTVTDIPMSTRNQPPDFTSLTRELETAPDPATVGTDGSPIVPMDRVIDRLENRKKKKSRLPMMLGGSILAVAVGIGLVLGSLFKAPDRSSTADNTSDTEEIEETEEIESTDEPLTPDQPAVVVYRPQTVVVDDPQVPWESPTGALPIDVGLMPPSPDFVLALRPRLLNENAQARKFIDAWGPRFQQLADTLVDTTKVSLAEMERVNVSFHSSGAGQYHLVTVVEFAEPMEQETLWTRLGKPQTDDLGLSGLRTFDLGSQVVYFEPPFGAQATEKTITRFGFGPKEFMTDAFDSLGPEMSGRSVGLLLNRSDRDRHVSLIIRNAGLLSEEARWLFDGQFASLRRPLSLFFDDRMEAVKLSLHFDQGGSYLEWMSEQNQDLKDDELVELLPERFADFRDQLTRYVATLPPHPYWATVQQRFDNMLHELVSRMRIGRERDGVVANCWLPEAAPHNLFVAGELVLNGNDFSQTAPTVTTGPKTLQELLDTPRSLTVTNDPDLINLLRQIEQEIKDDLPQLPFDFRIRMLGNDLAAEGITQNQRPGRVEVNQLPLGEILAQIMLQANPDKSATSPSDEKCKLVWVLGPDPDDPNTMAVLVTTRTAANQKNMQLPAIFSSE